MPQDYTETVRSIYQALGRGDIPFLSGIFDPQIEWNEGENFLYADRNPYIGLPAVLEGVFGRIAADWDGFSAVPDEILGSGDTVISFGRYRATHKTTGTPVNAQFVHVFRFKDGKAIRFQQYTDTAQFQQAAGRTLSAKA